MATQREFEDLLRALQNTGDVNDLVQALDGSATVDDLLSALNGPAKCEVHFKQYLLELERLAVGVAEIRRLGAKAGPDLKLATAGTLEALQKARERVRACGDCSESFERFRTSLSLK